MNMIAKSYIGLHCVLDPATDIYDCNCAEFLVLALNNGCYCNYCNPVELKLKLWNCETDISHFFTVAAKFYIQKCINICHKLRQVDNKLSYSVEMDDMS